MIRFHFSKSSILRRIASHCDAAFVVPLRHAPAQNFDAKNVARYASTTPNEPQNLADFLGAARVREFTDTSQMCVQASRFIEISRKETGFLAQHDTKNFTVKTRADKFAATKMVDSFAPDFADFPFVNAAFHAISSTRNLRTPRFIAVFCVAIPCLGGCSWARSPDIETATSSTRNAPAITKTKAPSLWSSWLDALLHGSKNAATTRTKPLVFVDVSALAKRHPAWQLADRLSATNSSAPNAASSQNAATNFRSSASNTPRFSASANGFPMPQIVISAPRLWPAPRDFGANRVLDSANSRGGNAVNVSETSTLNRQFVGGARREIDMTTLQNNARRQNDGSLNAFLQAAQTTQQKNRRTQIDEARATLDDEIAEARTVVLPPLEPVGLPAEVQLEITNLRLKLLPNSNTSVADRALAQERLFQLQALWRERLRAQEDQILQEWARQRDEEPRRLRREGEARIVELAQRIRRVDAARIALLRDDQRRFLAEDFAARDTLSISLPAFSSYLAASRFELSADSSNLGAISTPFPAFSSAFDAQNSSRTRGFEYSISPNFAEFGANLGAVNVATRVRELRNQALRDARDWAQNAARRNNWRLAPNAAGATNGTNAVLQTLGLS